MSVVLYFIYFAIFTSRVVHNHHIVVFQVLAYKLVIETLRSVFLYTNNLTLLIVSSPFEFCWRHAQTFYKNAINLCQHHFFTFRQLSRLHFTQFKSKFTQLPFQNHGHLTRIIALERFRHCRFRNDSILHNQVRHTSKLTTITNRIFHQPVHLTVIHRQVSCIYNSLQEQIGLLQQIVKRVVVLRKFEFRQIILGNHLGTEHIQARKKPTTARRLLIRNAFSLYLMRKMRVNH